MNTLHEIQTIDILQIQSRVMKKTKPYNIIYASNHSQTWQIINTSINFQIILKMK